MKYESPKIEELGTLEELTGKPGTRGDGCSMTVGDKGVGKGGFNCSGHPGP